MARFARVVGVGRPHHVTQRGNGRAFILANDADRTVYLGLLRQNIELHGITLMGYCLMSNQCPRFGPSNVEERSCEALLKEASRQSSLRIINPHQILSVASIMSILQNPAYWARESGKVCSETNIALSCRTTPREIGQRRAALRSRPTAVERDLNIRKTTVPMPFSAYRAFSADRCLG